MTDAHIVLETPRTRLRTWRADDIEVLAAMNADAEVMRFFPRTLTRSESAAFLERVMQDHAERGFAPWVLERRDDSAFLGFVGLDVPRFSPQSVEILWRLARDFWGFGYASDAASAVLRAALSDKGGLAHLKVGRIVSFTARINRTSERVMQRIGMRHLQECDFLHPALPTEHPLAPHVFYALGREELHAAGELCFTR